MKSTLLEPAHTETGTIAFDPTYGSLTLLELVSRSIEPAPTR